MNDMADNQDTNSVQADSNDKQSVTDSQFHMWRALFAMVHGDGVVTSEERTFMWKAIEDNGFSNDQLYTLKQEMDNPSSIDHMFKLITDQEDRSRFFDLARVLCWCDGDFDEQEQAIMSRLKRIHLSTVDFDKVMETVQFELEQSKPRIQNHIQNEVSEKKTIWKKLFSKK